VTVLPDFDAIVVAGGSARRLGGIDKPGIRIGSTSLLDLVLSGLAGAGHIVVVGPTRPTAVPVRWCREEPAGGGPVAALAAGFGHTRADVILVLAADLPGIGPAVPALRTALSRDPKAAAAELIDPSGRANHLAAAWRRVSLERQLQQRDPIGRSMRSLGHDVGIIAVPDPSGWGADCDTWADIEAARDRQIGIRDE
jgi:molybdopterin-guanine dinucleotide biosynthesis protein A